MVHGEKFASNYKLAEILVDDYTAHIVRERQTLDDVLKGERVV